MKKPKKPKRIIHLINTDEDPINVDFNLGRHITKDLAALVDRYSTDSGHSGICYLMPTHRIDLTEKGYEFTSPEAYAMFLYRHRESASCKDFNFQYHPSRQDGFGIEGSVTWGNSENYAAFGKVLEGNDEIQKEDMDSPPKVGVIVNFAPHQDFITLLKDVLGYEVQEHEHFKHGGWKPELRSKDGAKVIID